MWELDQKEGWMLKNWWFWIVVLEKALESPWDSKEIKPVSPKGNQPWIFIGRTDAETPILWPPDVKNWLTGKDPDAGKDWGQEERGTTEDEMVGWHHRLNGHEFGWTLGVGDGQEGLACCGSWGRKESDITEWLNWTGLCWGLKESKRIPSSIPATPQLLTQPPTQAMESLCSVTSVPGDMSFNVSSLPLTYPFLPHVCFLILQITTM